MLPEVRSIPNLTTFFFFCFVTAFDDSLDFIAVQEKLLADFQSVVNSMRGKQKNSLDAQVDAVLYSKAKKLKEGDHEGLITVRIWTQCNS
jgi:hypothetical protein